MLHKPTRGSGRARHAPCGRLHALEPAARFARRDLGDLRGIYGFADERRLTVFLVVLGNGGRPFGLTAESKQAPSTRRIEAKGVMIGGALTSPIRTRLSRAGS